jgi:hypothetical protein
MFYRVQFMSLESGSIKENEVIHIQQGTMGAENFYREYVDYYIHDFKETKQEYVLDDITTLYSLLDSDYGTPDKQTVQIVDGDTEYKWMITPITEELFNRSPAIL